MSDRFRKFVQIIGSGPHTGKSLTREQAAAAMEMMLLQIATPAQIGAFFIAHRIKRPTGAELAGMLDTYARMGPQLQPVASHGRSPVIFGIPYDGRSRTVPIAPLLSLILTEAGIPVILHGGDRMPTKYGIPLVDIWQEWGIDWTKIALDRIQEIFELTKLGFIYTPTHFPAAAGLTPYRDQIGKRPPIATLELLWCPYAGDARLIFGYVHPPTEQTALVAATLRNTPHQITTVKGLEGSSDLPRDRAVIIGVHQSGRELERIFLHHYDYGLSNVNPPLLSTPELMADFESVLRAEPSESLNSVLWNAGFYLWHCGGASDMAAGMKLARELLVSGAIRDRLESIRKCFKET
ncbi:anthranilate phosphoribosyltransferase family protein [Chamaesiphon sp. VAR_48_metabat_403]|uniref:anthranilate phosphoribosyltransferase family protein n=1 Tax=Chamaesiphon sp. VAR_48_metabat_403 TaxID=2964700 RepID=UPI00286D79CF|nr:anthranilate phosphoribosyltransferase family protein [Chamaesiphon sp. VAR_48_metabat_403]